MCRYLLILAWLLISFAVAVADVAADPADMAAETAAITEAVKAFVIKEPVERVYVEKMVPPFAAVIVTVQGGDGGAAYLQKRENGWAVILYSSSPTEEGLARSGVPEDKARRLLE